VTLAPAPVLATLLPATLNYQGFLTDQKSGVPVNGSVSVTFKIYSALTAGTSLYAETQSLVASNGVINAQIGSVTALPATLLFDRPYWLEVVVGSDTLSPRQPIASAAYARSTGALPSRSGKNAAAGDGALMSLQYGSQNVAYGDGALSGLTTGVGNIAIGWDAGIRLTNGDYNLYVGHTGIRDGTVQYPTPSKEVNTIRIGDAASHRALFLAGVRGAYASALNLQPMMIDGDGQVVASNSVSSVSDRNAKENFAEIDSADVLAKVAQLPLQTWNYRDDRYKVKHLGPVAQDFHAAFDVGSDDKHITMVDADGVALAAIQGLYRLVQGKDVALQRQARELAQLKSTNAALVARVEALEAGTQAQLALLKQSVERLLAQGAQATQVVLMNASH
jgi:hypothetical protein